MRRSIAFLLLFVGAGSFGLLTYATSPPDSYPGPDARCPVCGMFVAKFPNWIARVELEGGQSDFFDGPKDMFRYLLDVEKYRPGLSRDQVAAITVTDYYTVKQIDAERAFFVVGSDVKGPMGKELVPFGTEAAAIEFKADHKGEKILRFGEIDRECINELK